MRYSRIFFSFLIMAGLNLCAVAVAQETQPASCQDCHDGEHVLRPPGPPAIQLAASIHADLDCSDCHQSISMETLIPGADKPHGETVQPVDCGECHTDAAEEYKKHGRLAVGKDPDLPSCWNCHGAHDILPTTDTRSRVHPIHLPATCRTCHTNVDLVKRHKWLRGEPIKLYESSVHGQASKMGVYVSATCNDCHSAMDPDGMRTAHRILSAADPESTIYHFNIPDTCGQCHEPVTKDYWDGIHGQLVKRGAIDSPVCTHCHGEHGIIKSDDARSPVGAARVAEATCAPCHESEVLNEKYGIPAGRLRSYVDSYHGLKAKAGDVHVANCASCHGTHRILPHTDPSSSINANNLQATCGTCHPGITTELAQAPIHETATGIKTGWPHFVRIFYLWLIGVTIGLMLLHNIADWVRHVKIMRRKPYVVRLTANETLQHWVLTVSFVVLVISGFSLRFSEAWWVQLLFGWGGGAGFEFRGLVHRIAAVVFAFCCIWHLVYLFGHRGRRALRDMILAKRDFTDIRDSALFFLGLRADRPRFARFSYTEKCEYWALVWGGVIMSVTGIVLWFDNFFVEHWNLPKGVLDVILVVHYYEAWLATLAIAVWHGYSTVFSPSVYPMNPAWLGGKMPKDMYTHEHPDGPRLKSRVQRVFEEEEEEETPQAEVDSAPATPPKPSAKKS
ncbi:MAG TPA: cytochrome b/b6 domain-containing protein [Phycisphaerae bacterium]|nr:cytochrome b/b6 domain-containing protein [Phycisphaerae bacterium]